MLSGWAKLQENRQFFFSKNKNNLLSYKYFRTLNLDKNYAESLKLRNVYIFYL